MKLKKYFFIFFKNRFWKFFLKKIFTQKNRTFPILLIYTTHPWSNKIKNSKKLKNLFSDFQETQKCSKPPSSSKRKDRLGRKLPIGNQKLPKPY